MPRTPARSISVPIVLSSITVLLTVALLVGWILVIRENQSLTRAFWGNLWLMTGGIVSLALVMSVVVLFSVSLVREILESRRQQMFIDSVTHELKSPLASIQLCLDTQAREGLSAEQRQRLREMMQSDVERLSVFVDDILQASRISHGLRSQSWAVVDATQLLTECVLRIRRRHHLADDAIRLNAPARLEISTDPTALETIVHNILDNAVKYSSPPVRVEIDLLPEPSGQIRITVRDQGIGVERRQLRRIFRRFYRAPGPLVGERSGSGLGLYVVAQLVRNLGGKIQAESAGVGRGMTVHVLLPAGAAAP